MSLLLSRTQGYCYHLSKFHIYVLVYCIGVFLSGLLHSVSNHGLNLFSLAVEAWSHAGSLPSEPPGKPLNHPAAREFPEVLVF